MNQRAREREFFLHAVRVLNDQLLRIVLQLHQLEQLFRALRDLCAAEAVHASGEREHLRAGEAFEEVEVFRHDADSSFHFHRLLGDIEVEYAQAAAGRREQPREHLDRGRLPRAVRSEKSEETAATYFQVDMIDRDEVAKLFDERKGFDCGYCGHCRRGIRNR